jgi:DivIVA domain-containing protein
MAWVVLTVTLMGTAFYVGLLVQRQVSPPIVPIDRANLLRGYGTGDAALVRAVTTGDLREGDVVAARARGAVVVARIESIRAGTYQLTGATERPIEATSRELVGRVDRRLPLLGWPLLAARHPGVQILAGMAVVGFVVVLVFTGRAPLSFLDDEDVDGEGPPVPGLLALPAGPPVAYRERPMSITPDDLRQVRFAVQRKGGYDTEAVDRALDTVADNMEALLQERLQLIERLRSLEAELERRRALEAPAGALPAADGTMVELLGETRAIRSLLQAVLTQGGQLAPPPPR